jgi:hypothetical protein
VRQHTIIDFLIEERKDFQEMDELLISNRITPSAHQALQAQKIFKKFIRDAEPFELKGTPGPGQK